MTTPALACRGLRKRFGGVQAIDGVDLVVRRGQALAVVGPNGAGKSTLLKLFAGVHRPDEGSLDIAGKPFVARRAHDAARRGVALAHQIPRPFLSLDVRNNVRAAVVARAGAVNHRSADRLTEGVLERVGLAGRADVPAGALGILDLKRLEIARALATRPDVLLLDEVAAGLTGRELDDAIRLIRALHRDGCSIVLVEHVERVVHEIVDEVLVLDWGRPLAFGTPSAVADDPEVRRVYLGDRTAAPRRRSLVAADAADVLALERVTANYGQISALRDVDLRIGRAEVVAVLGANGAGKSTLSGAISGLVPVASGRVVAFGADVTSRPAHVRARLGIAHCQEGRRVFGELTVAENLELGAPFGLDREVLAARFHRVEELFPRLRERHRQAAGTLSGGEQQMLAIARALMAEPRLLICDEISLGLAPVVVDALYEALAAVNEAGVAVLIIEQNVHRCLAFADRAYVLSRGVVTYEGPPAALEDDEFLNHAYFGIDPTGRPAERTRSAS